MCSYGVFGPNLFEFFAMVWHKKSCSRRFLGIWFWQRILCWLGKKKRKKNRTPHRKRKQNSEDNVASVCEQDARKTCGNESTIYYECGFKAILKRAFSSECKTKSTRSTFLVLVLKKKSLWRDKFLLNACNDIFPSQSARFGNINILFDLFVKYIY